MSSFAIGNGPADQPQSPGGPLVRRPATAVAEPVGHAVVPGSTIPVLTFKVRSYGSDTREEAEAYLWDLYQRRYPGAFVQIIHADDENWEYVR